MEVPCPLQIIIKERHRFTSLHKMVNFDDFLKIELQMGKKWVEFVFEVMLKLEKHFWNTVQIFISKIEMGKIHAILPSKEVWFLTFFEPKVLIN